MKLYFLFTRFSDFWLLLMSTRSDKDFFFQHHFQNQDVRCNSIVSRWSLINVRRRKTRTLRGEKNRKLWGDRSCKCNSGGEKQLAKLATSLTPAVTHKRKMDWLCCCCCCCQSRRLTQHLLSDTKDLKNVRMIVLFLDIFWHKQKLIQVNQSDIVLFFSSLVLVILITLDLVN